MKRKSAGWINKSSMRMNGILTGSHVMILIFKSKIEDASTTNLHSNTPDNYQKNGTDFRKGIKREKSNYKELKDKPNLDYRKHFNQCNCPPGLWCLHLPRSKLMARIDRPKYTTLLRTIKTHCVDYGEEDEDRLDDDNNGYFRSVYVHVTSTKKLTSKDRRPALPKYVWQSMSRLRSNCMELSAKWRQSSDNVCIQKSRCVNSPINDHQSNLFKTSTDMSEIDATIATPVNETSSQLEVDKENNKKE